MALSYFSKCYYGCEIWAPYLNQDITKWESTPSGQIHTQFIKSILGVNRPTTNVLARGEVGRTSLQSDILALSIGYIKYPENKPSSLVKSAFEYESLLTEQRTTIRSLFNIHENRLKTHLKNNEDIKTISKSKLKYIINEIFNSIWITQLNNYPKADTYKQFKTRLKFECYLNGKNRKLRVSYTKLRVSDHKLMFEVGR